MTETSHIPKGMRTINPYLKIEGAAQLIQFLTAAFDGELLERHEDNGRIAHAKVQVGDTVVEISDATTEWPALPCGLHVYIPNIDATHARAVQAGAEEIYPPTDHDYGERGSALRGPGGIEWYLATASPQQ